MALVGSSWRDIITRFSVGWTRNLTLHVHSRLKPQQDRKKWNIKPKPSGEISNFVVLVRDVQQSRYRLSVSVATRLTVVD